MLTFAIGDLHGCVDRLTQLLAHCRTFGAGPRRYVFLGDYIDRGPNSRDAVAQVMALERENPNGLIALMGNHEDMLGRALAGGRAIQHWLANGGDATLRSYGVANPRELPRDHLEWLLDRPLAFDDGLRYFAHAGVDAGVPLDEQPLETLLWIREPFLSSEADYGRLVVHGHTPVRSGTPDLRPNRLNIDTGAVFGGPLTAAVFDEARTAPIAFVTDRGELTTLKA